ncbi:MAG: D-glycero-beta-D-manno-heptose 1-phosphate adenylyltransferase [Acidobacteria bacterium]|nr:D-glycero-beta-D-manno-heptose 1-phosphate adenylyltransferase [Acidobacteriota bacterium]
MIVEDHEELARIVGRLKGGGQRVVFTNGCFDILHPGHLHLLSQARRLGDALIVGINSDASVRRLKGPGRPIFPQQERAELLSALQVVDYVTIFEDDTPRQLIERIIPQVLVKGGDWGKDEIVGGEIVEAAGGQVLSLPFVEGFSTSSIIQKILEQE